MIWQVFYKPQFRTKSIKKNNLQLSPHSIQYVYYWYATVCFVLCSFLLKSSFENIKEIYWFLYTNQRVSGTNPSKWGKTHIYLSIWLAEVIHTWDTLSKRTSYKSSPCKFLGFHLYLLLLFIKSVFNRT